jgi:hypothetical protein
VSELQTDTAETPLGRQNTRRRLGKLKLITLSDMDRRTAAYQKTAELISAISQDLGGDDQISASEQQLIQRGAVLGAVAEHIETLWLAGGEIDAGEYCTILNCQRRIFESIGLSRRTRDALKPRQPSMVPLSDLLPEESPNATEPVAAATCRSVS